MPAPVGFLGAGTSLQALPQPRAGSCTFGKGAGGSAWHAALLVEEERRTWNFRDLRDKMPHCFPRLVFSLRHGTPSSSPAAHTPGIPGGEEDCSWHAEPAARPHCTQRGSGTMGGHTLRINWKTLKFLFYFVFPLSLLLHLQIKL